MSEAERAECPECGTGGEWIDTVAGNRKWGCPNRMNSWFTNTNNL